MHVTISTRISAAQITKQIKHTRKRSKTQTKRVHKCSPRQNSHIVSCGKQRNLHACIFPSGGSSDVTKVGYLNKFTIHLMTGASCLHGLGHWKEALRLLSRPRDTASGGFRHTGWARFSRGGWTPSRVFSFSGIWHVNVNSPKYYIFRMQFALFYCILRIMRLTAGSKASKLRQIAWYNVSTAVRYGYYMMSFHPAMNVESCKVHGVQR